MARRKPADWNVCPSLEPLEPRLLLSAQVVGAELDDLIPAAAQSPYFFEFSVDIGSDTELSDPNVDGDEGFDPGDVYQWQGPPVTPPQVHGGRDGFKDDQFIFGWDPWPDPPDPFLPPATRVPVGEGGPQNYYEYFDLDGHDQVDIPLQQWVPPDRPLPDPLPADLFTSACVFSPDFLMVSFDDDTGPGWPVGDVPVIRPSPAGLVYGTTAGQDEIVGLNLMNIGPGRYTVIGTYGVADEATVHQSLAPNPDLAQRDDDDVDSLDIVVDQGVCPYWLFSPDHEANLGLDPGGIYEVNPFGGGSVQVIDEQIHLGLHEDTDIDAFELAWTTDAAGAAFLTLLFSVDDDDVVTPNADESGGLDPRMIYGSYLMGFSFPLLDAPLQDDVDGLTAWSEPVEPEELDWGDAPDAVGALGYPTLAIHNGASHIIAGPWLGDANDNPDAENDGQPDPNALGDDNDGNDDEDGVSIPVLVQGVTANIQVEVNGGGGWLDMWIDWNGNQSWLDAGEQVFSGLLPDGPHVIPVTAPLGSVVGQTFLRARINTTGPLRPEGPAYDGEVEDHEVVIEAPEKDWGDAPDSAVAAGYPTLSGNNGANHVIGGPWLGDANDNPDAENDGQPDPNALGDDNDGNDDEDGVSIPVLVQGQPAGITLQVSGGGGVVEAWVDWNGNQSWLDAGEQVFTGLLGDGVHAIAVTPPVDAAIGQTFARFRISGKGGLPPTGPAADGEVEDHEVFIDEAVTFPKWEQYPEPAQPENVYYGWNEYSVYGGQQIAADDWVCTTDAPVTDIHWWGSYIGWDYADLPPEIPSSFYITMWTDVPADPAEPASFSHPGQVVWEMNCTNFVSQWVGWDFDPLTGTYEATFQFNQILYPEEYFYQGEAGTEPDGENIYWISIAAVYPQGPASPRYPWGWKTRPRDASSPAPDDAVRIFDPTRPSPGLLYGDGEPIEELGVSWDLAFELTTTEGVEKWRQEPNLEDTGMDVLAGPFSVDPDGTVYYEKFLADDFRCTESGLITEITFWSSYLDDRHLMEPGVLPSFSLALYSDVPVGPNGWSTPGELLWDAYLTPTVEQVYAWDVWEQFYDPNQDRIIGQDHVVWQYTFEIEPVEAFNQEEGNIYWLGVHHSFDLSGDGLVDFMDLSMLVHNWPAGFGWKTSLDAFNDDAVFVDVNTFDGDPHVTPVTQDWRELRYPKGHPFEGKSIDLAFAITTEPDKWLQKPDLAPTGMDVNASDNGPESIVLADDWMCTQVGEIDQIIVWGSWLHDRLPIMGPAGVTFTLSIHSDVPAEQSPTGYSMPGDILWLRDFDAGSYTVSKYATDLDEGWYDPITGEYQPLGDTLCWIYAFDLAPGEFIQMGKPDDPEIYWLDVQAHYDDSTAYFGWKTSLDHWNDDAVYYQGREPVPPDALWKELRYPPGHPMKYESIDLAFKIIGPGEKWSQPPEQYIPDDGYNGWDEYSVYGSNQIVADDWLCTTADPVTDVHWWGSFQGWSEPDPPTMPSAFHLGIWTDVPAGVGVPGVPFSHPGKMIWEVTCSNYTWDFVGWDFDPRDPMAAPEATFYFEQDLLEDEWFWQEPDENIYWISIAAEYPAGVPAQPWGWKTRPRDPASPAPDDAVRIFNPTDPVPGDFYANGWPIEALGVSWDMAFVLTTRDLVAPTVTDVQVKGTVWSVPDYSIPVGSSAQDGPLGWSTIDQIEIVFSEDVTVTQADMTLTGTTAGVYAFSGFNYNGATYTATWTLVNRIDTDVLTIDLSDTVRDLGLNALDGEWVDEVSTYPSGNGLAGADFVFGFKVLPGDASSNNVVDGGDYTIWADNYGHPATDYTTGDFNGDGTVDGGDYTIWADHYSQTVAAAMGGLSETLTGPPAMGGAGVGGSSLAAGVASTSAAAPSAVPGRIKLSAADLDVVAQPAGADRASGRSADESGLNDWRRASRRGRAARVRLELDDYVDILEPADLSVLKPAV